MPNNLPACLEGLPADVVHVIEHHMSQFGLTDEYYDASVAAYVQEELFSQRNWEEFPPNSFHKVYLLATALWFTGLADHRSKLIGLVNCPARFLRDHEDCLVKDLIQSFYRDFYALCGSPNLPVALSWFISISYPLAQQYLNLSLEAAQKLMIEVNETALNLPVEAWSTDEGPIPASVESEELSTIRNAVEDKVKGMLAQYYQQLTAMAASTTLKDANFTERLEDLCGRLAKAEHEKSDLMDTLAEYEQFVKEVSAHMANSTQRVADDQLAQTFLLEQLRGRVTQLEEQLGSDTSSVHTAAHPFRAPSERSSRARSAEPETHLRLSSLEAKLEGLLAASPTPPPTPDPVSALRREFDDREQKLRKEFQDVKRTLQREADDLRSQLSTQESERLNLERKQVEAVASARSGLSATISSLTQDIASSNSRIDDLDTSLNELFRKLQHEEISSLRKAIAASTSAQATFDGFKSLAKSELDSQASRLSTLEQLLRDLPATKQLPSLKTTVQRMETQLATAEQSIDDLKSETNIMLSTATKTLETNIEKLANVTLTKKEEARSKSDIFKKLEPETLFASLKPFITPLSESLIADAATLERDKTIRRCKDEAAAALRSFRSTTLPEAVKPIVTQMIEEAQLAAPPTAEGTPIPAADSASLRAELRSFKSTTSATARELRDALDRLKQDHEQLDSSLAACDRKLKAVAGAPTSIKNLERRFNCLDEKKCCADCEVTDQLDSRVSKLEDNNKDSAAGNLVRKLEATLVDISSRVSALEDGPRVVHPPTAPVAHPDCCVKCARMDQAEARLQSFEKTTDTLEDLRLRLKSLEDQGHRDDASTHGTNTPSDECCARCERMSRVERALATTRERFSEVAERLDQLDSDIVKMNALPDAWRQDIATSAANLKAWMNDPTHQHGPRGSPTAKAPTNLTAHLSGSTGLNVSSESIASTVDPALDVSDGSIKSTAASVEARRAPLFAPPGAMPNLTRDQVALELMEVEGSSFLDARKHRAFQPNSMIDTAFFCPPTYHHAFTQIFNFRLFYPVADLRKLSENAKDRLSNASVTAWRAKEKPGAAKSYGFYLSYLKYFLSKIYELSSEYYDEMKGLSTVEQFAHLISLVKHHVFQNHLRFSYSHLLAALPFQNAYIGVQETLEYLKEGHVNDPRMDQFRFLLSEVIIIVALTETITDHARNRPSDINHPGEHSVHAQHLYSWFHTAQNLDPAVELGQDEFYRKFNSTRKFYTQVDSDSLRSLPSAYKLKATLPFVVSFMFSVYSAPVEDSVCFVPTEILSQCSNGSHTPLSYTGETVELSNHHVEHTVQAQPPSSQGDNSSPATPREDDADATPRGEDDIDQPTHWPRQQIHRYIEQMKTAAVEQQTNQFRIIVTWRYRGIPDVEAWIGVLKPKSNRGNSAFIVRYDCELFSSGLVSPLLEHGKRSPVDSSLLDKDLEIFAIDEYEGKIPAGTKSIKSGLSPSVVAKIFSAAGHPLCSQCAKPSQSLHPCARCKKAVCTDCRSGFYCPSCVITKKAASVSRPPSPASVPRAQQGDATIEDEEDRLSEAGSDIADEIFAAPPPRSSGLRRGKLGKVRRDRNGLTFCYVTPNDGSEAVFLHQTGTGFPLTPGLSITFTTSYPPGARNPVAKKPAVAEADSDFHLGEDGRPVLATVKTGADFMNLPLHLPPTEMQEAVEKPTQKARLRIALLVQEKIRNDPLLQASTIALAAARSVHKIRQDLKWSWGTTQGAMGTLSSMMRRLDSYAAAMPVSLPSMGTWLDALRAVTKHKNQEDVKQSTPASHQHVHRAINSLMSAPSTHQAAFLLIIAWSHAARVGNIVTLRKKNFHNNHSSIRWTKAKTTASRGPYSTHSDYGQFTTFVASHLLNFHDEAFPCQQKDVKVMIQALKEQDPTYELRSLRRGALQSLASVGTSTEDLLLFSGHTSAKSLLRYLGWGTKHGVDIQRGKNAAKKALHPQQ